MRINSVRIDHYGPMQPFVRYEMGDFILVHGPNEEGKTLLLDAITRLLFRKNLGRRIKDFGNMTRVDDDPEGYIVVTTGGDEVRLGRGETLSSVLPITAADFRNIFVVRDSDVGMVKAKDYFTHVSEKLTGLRTSEIAAIKRALQQRGRLTSPRSDGELANNVETGHAKDKLQAAKRCVEEIDELLGELQAGGFDHLEQELARRREVLAIEKERLETAQQAHVRRRYGEAAQALEELEALRKVQRELRGVDEAVFDRWKQAERDRDRLQAELEEARAAADKAETRLREMESELSDCRQDEEKAGGRLRRFDETVVPALRRFEELESELIARRPQLRFWRWSLFTAAAMIITGAVLVGIGTAAWPAWLVAGSAAVALFSAVQTLAGLKAEGRLARARSVLEAVTSPLDAQAETIDDLRRAHAAMASEAEQAARKASDAAVRFRTQKNAADEATLRARELRAAVEEAVDHMTTARIESGTQNLEAFHKALTRKRECENRARYLEHSLAKLLGPREGDTLDRWRERLREHLSVDGADESPPDPASMERLGSAVKTSEAAVADIQEALARGRRALRDVEFRINESGAIPNERIVCRTTVDLVRLREVLSDFVVEIERERDDARAALAIIEEIEAEEEARVIELFGPGRSVSNNFRTITGGAYDEVTFEPGSGAVRARRSDGRWLAADELSGGTYDQLFFALRLSLAETILGGKRGFFLLDDPFVKSDPKRLSAQLNLLRRLAGDGWQIFLFSAKQEIADALEADVRSGQVERIRLRDDISSARMVRPRTSSGPFTGDLFPEGPS